MSINDVRAEAKVIGETARADARAAGSTVSAASGAAVVVRGERGERGEPGKDGKDGRTPIKGVDYFDGKDGRDGRDGVDGKDGRTPVKGIDYFDGKDGANGKDGRTPVKGVDYFDGYTPVKGVDYFDGQNGSDAAATDVQVNYKSVTVDGVANIPIAGATEPGVVCISGGGLTRNGITGWLRLDKATDAYITARVDYSPIVPMNLDYAVKAAMCDGKGAAWTDAEKTAARSRMGVQDAVTDDHINALIDAKLEAVENGSY